MGVVAMFVLLGVILWDIYNFKLAQRNLFIDTYRRLNWHVILVAVAFGVCFIFKWIELEYASVLVMCGIVPVYLWGRINFLKEFTAQKSYKQSSFFLTAELSYVIILWLFGALSISLVLFNLSLLFPQLISEFDELLLTTILSTALILYLVYESSERMSLGSFWDKIGLDSVKRSKVRVVILPIVLGLIFAVSSAALVFVRGEQPITPLSEILKSVTSPISMTIFLILAVIVAPFVEEIVFRGFFYKMLSRIKGKRFALYFISLLFAAMHVGQYWGDWAAIGIVTVLGFTLTLMRALTHTTLSSIILHYTYNGGVAVVTSILIARDNPQLLESFIVMF
ncbi:MAG: membrane protease YdiL (CAAX protease family) [Lysobacterales bacterium]|jgi:membrane protease YdiL (CAAX protease family)